MDTDTLKKLLADQREKLSQLKSAPICLSRPTTLEARLSVSTLSIGSSSTALKLKQARGMKEVIELWMREVLDPKIREHEAVIQEAEAVVQKLTTEIARQTTVQHPVPDAPDSDRPEKKVKVESAA